MIQLEGSRRWDLGISTVAISNLREKVEPDAFLPSELPKNFMLITAFISSEDNFANWNI